MRFLFAVKLWNRAVCERWSRAPPDLEPLSGRGSDDAEAV